MTIANVEYEEMLEQAIDNLTNENFFLKSLLESFWTGDVPEDAVLDHMVLAKYGRKRLEEKNKTALLLSKQGVDNVVDQ